ncbi:MAG: ATP-binding protein [Gammaproteobacteria bacterium]
MNANRSESRERTSAGAARAEPSPRRLLAPRPHRRLLFRTYVIIVGGMIVTAALFDYGFARLQESLAPSPGPWVRASLGLVERRLAEADSDDRGLVVAELERELGFPVGLVPRDAIVHAGDAAAPDGIFEIFDDAGRSIFLLSSDRLGGAIRLGPVPDESTPQSRLLDAVPHLFYLSILVLVGIWLWPLIRDVDLLTRAARAFAADYRTPMSTRRDARTLEELAGSFDEMSARIRALIQAQKDLTSALSHEIRTPLARIKFAMAVIAQKAPIADELESIDQDVREIDRLIGAMLEFARLDHPDTRVRWENTPIAELIAEAAGRCLLGEGQRIEHDCPDVLVPMDPRMIDLALSNLLVNAARYAEERIRIVFHESEGAYALAVEDDGPGIPEDRRDEVFKAFARLDDSRSRGTGGYGLGLAIVARIAALHGGQARAERSELGGARIVMMWPKPKEREISEGRSA